MLEVSTTTVVNSSVIMADVSPSTTLEFLELIGQLKHIDRTGWVLRHINNPESIAGHMYRMAIIVFLLRDKPNIDRARCLELALVHDMPECIVGDLTPMCGVSPDEKHRKEDEAMQRLAHMAGSSSGDYLYKLYKEYEKQETQEAKLVKELDMFDMILQAFEYEKKEDNMQLQEFFDATKNKFSEPYIKSLVAELNEQREKYFRDKSKMNL